MRVGVGLRGGGSEGLWYGDALSSSCCPRRSSFVHTESFSALHVYLPKFTPGTCDGTGMWTDLLNASILFEFHAFKDNTPATDPKDFGTVTYTVDFGDGQTFTSPSTVQYHSYSQTGTFGVSIKATNIVSKASCLWTIRIVEGEWIG